MALNLNINVLHSLSILLGWALKQVSDPLSHMKFGLTADWVVCFKKSCAKGGIVFQGLFEHTVRDQASVSICSFTNTSYSTCAFL